MCVLIAISGCGWGAFFQNSGLDELTEHIDWTKKEEAELSIHVGKNERDIIDAFGKPDSIAKANPPSFNLPEHGDELWIYNGLSGRGGKRYNFVFKNRRLIVVIAV